MAEKELCFVGEFEMINKRNDMGIDLENIDWYLNGFGDAYIKIHWIQKYKTKLYNNTHNFF